MDFIEKSTANKQRYRELCKVEKTIPIFSKDWWLDAACGADNWSVILAEKGNKIFASMPYFTMKSRFGFTTIAMPMLTQTMGIWIKYPEDQKITTRLSYEKEIITEIIQYLPRFDSFNQNFHYSFKNWLPFYWKGFSQTTRYTYVIEDLSDLGTVFSHFNGSLRSKIRQAEKAMHVYEEEDIQKFFYIIQKIFRKQGLNTPYLFEFFRKLDKACSEQNCRKILFAEDEKGNLHGGIYVVWDEESAYSIAGGADPSFKNIGADPLLCWEAIKFASTVSKKFDFAGSMIEPVEFFMRSFGGIQKPYFSITRINSRFIKCKNYLRELVKR